MMICKIAVLLLVLLLAGCKQEKKVVDIDADIEEQLPAEEKTSQHTEKEKVNMENLLRTSMLPVGSTMYIWGGGWNEEDTGAGVGATTIGVHPQWQIFADLQTAEYKMEKHRYQSLNGLDCSGYIGWMIYNLMETESGKPGYVYKANQMAEKYSDMGWGDYIESPKEFLTGDIVSQKSHVWMALGTCEDGNVVLLHASPPGVSICGTKLPDGSESEAIRLARQYMEIYAPEWQEKYPNRSVSYSYLNAIGLFRWDENVMPMTEKYQEMDVEEVLQKIVGDR